LHKSIVSSKINTLWQYITKRNISISKTGKTKMASMIHLLQHIFKSRSRSNRIFR